MIGMTQALPQMGQPIRPPERRVTASDQPHTAFGTVESAVEAMKLGAYDYITKPTNADALRLAVSRALDHLRLREEVQTLRSRLDQKSTGSRTS